MRALGLLLLLIFAAACQPEPPAGGPSRRVATGSRSQLFTFDSNAEGWTTYTMPGDQAAFRVENGALQGAVLPDQGYIWSLSPGSYADVIIEAALRQDSGRVGSVFGVMCRADADGNGYYFLVSSDQQVAIGVATPARRDLDWIVPWRISQAVKPGYVTNTVRAVCAGDYLALFVNDVFVAEAEDVEFGEGQAGVTLAAVEQTAWVHFDSVLLRDAALRG